MDGRVKCWGANFFGSLGVGDTFNRGNEAKDMGDALPFVLLFSACTSCAAGQRKVKVAQLEAEACIACDFASYSPLSLTASCSACPRGTYSLTEGSAECKLCPSGKHSNLVGSTDANNCLGCGNVTCVGSSSCEIFCAAGKFAACVSQGGYDCFDCPRGKFGREPGQALLQESAACELCPAGRYASAPGQMECDTCGPGKYMNATQLGAFSESACIFCQPGTYSSSNVLNGTCPVCLPGTYSESVGQGACTPCGPGRYNSYTNSTSGTECVRCPDGMLSDPNSTSPGDCKCKIGSYFDGNACLACPRGAVCDELGTTLWNLPLEENQWRSRNTSVAILEAPMGSRGGARVGDELCWDGYQGPLCAACSPHYFLARFKNKCDSCSYSRQTNFLLVSGVMLLILCFCAGVLVHTGKRLDRVRAARVLASKLDADFVAFRNARPSSERVPNVDVLEFNGENRLDLDAQSIEDSDRSITLGSSALSSDGIELSIRNSRADLLSEAACQSGGGYILNPARSQSIGLFPVAHPNAKKSGGAAEAVTRLTFQAQGAIGGHASVRDTSSNGVDVRSVKETKLRSFRSLNQRTPDSNSGTAGRIKLRLIKSLLLIMLDLYQVISLMPSVLSFSFPAGFRVFALLASLPASFDVPQFLPVACLGDFDYFNELITISLFPILMAFILVGLYALVIKFKGVTDVESRVTARVLFFEVFFLVTYITYPLVSVKTFKVFDCVNVFDADDSSISLSYLRIDYSISCSSERYNHLVIFASFMIVLIPLGIPLLYFFLVHRARSSINPLPSWPAAQGIEARSTKVALMPYKFLFEVYKPHLWWWEPFQCLRRQCLTGLLTFASRDSNVEMVLGCLMSLGFIKIHALFQPFVSLELNRFAELALWQVFFSFFATLFWHLGRRYDVNNDNFDAAMILINFASILVFFIKLRSNFAEIRVLKTFDTSPARSIWPLVHRRPRGVFSGAQAEMNRYRSSSGAGADLAVESWKSRMSSLFFDKRRSGSLRVSSYGAGTDDRRSSSASRSTQSDF